MTREECESKILEKLIEIAEICKEYNPYDNYLTMTIRGDYMAANNSYFEGSHKGGIINFFAEGEGVYICVH